MRVRFSRSARQLTEAAAEIAGWLRHDIESLSDYHRYSQMFGGKVGANVHTIVLEDALRSRGLTLDEFRAAAAKRGL